VLKQSHGTFKRASEVDEFRKSAAAEGLVRTLDPPKETARIYRFEEAKWRRVVKESRPSRWIDPRWEQQVLG